MYRNLKLFLYLIIGLLIPFILCGLAYSSPFLVCAPQPSNQVTAYIVNLDGNSQEVPPQDLGDGTVRLHYDLAGISESQHHVEIQSKNIWGVSDPAPFDFTKTLPATPEGISISEE